MVEGVEADTATRIDRLERRIADLESEVATLRQLRDRPAGALPPPVATRSVIDPWPAPPAPATS